MALASVGLGSLNAFLHPLPDPRHIEGLLATLSGGFTLLPVLTTAVLRRIGARRQAIVTIIVCLELILVMRASRNAPAYGPVSTAPAINRS
jgi:hypothetical protein